MKLTLFFSAVAMLLFLAVLACVKLTNTDAPRWVEGGMKCMGWALLAVAVFLDQSLPAVALAFFTGTFCSLYPPVVGFALCFCSVLAHGIATGNM